MLSTCHGEGARLRRDPAPSPDAESERARTSSGGELGLTPSLSDVQAHVLICTAMKGKKEQTGGGGGKEGRHWSRSRWPTRKPLSNEGVGTPGFPLALSN